MIKLRVQFVFLTDHGRSEESAYRAAYPAVERSAGDAEADDDVFLSIGERPENGFTHVTIWRKKPTMSRSDWTFNHEPSADPAGDYVYRATFALETPEQVMRSAERMILASVMPCQEPG